jgi:hypothetical protein
MVMKEVIGRRASNLRQVACKGFPESELLPVAAAERVGQAGLPETKPPGLHKEP